MRGRAPNSALLLALSSRASPRVTSRNDGVAGAHGEGLGDPRRLDAERVGRGRRRWRCFRRPRSGRRSGAWSRQPSADAIEAHDVIRPIRCSAISPRRRVAAVLEQVDALPRAEQPAGRLDRDRRAGSGSAPRAGARACRPGPRRHAHKPTDLRARCARNRLRGRGARPAPHSPGSAATPRCAGKKWSAGRCGCRSRRRQRATSSLIS